MLNVSGATADGTRSSAERFASSQLVPNRPRHRLVVKPVLTEFGPLAPARTGTIICRFDLQQPVGFGHLRRIQFQVDHRPPATLRPRSPPDTRSAALAYASARTLPVLRGRPRLAWLLILHRNIRRTCLGRFGCSICSTSRPPVSVESICSGVRPSNRRLGVRSQSRADASSPMTA